MAVAGLSLEDAEGRITQHLKQWLKDADVAVTFPIAGRRRPISENVDKPARIQRGSIYHIELAGAPADSPLVGPRRVEARGKVSLGPAYGRVKIDGLTLDEAESKIEEHLKDILTDPQVAVTLGDFAPPEGSRE